MIGDHTDIQVLSDRPNGVLVVENRSKGVFFTRVRLVVDITTGEVVYKTADFHRPWAIGVTADPAIEARLAELNAELQPILGEVIGNATVPIPRADSCVPPHGRDVFEGVCRRTAVGASRHRRHRLGRRPQAVASEGSYRRHGPHAGRAGVYQLGNWGAGELGNWGLGISGTRGSGTRGLGNWNKVEPMRW